MIELSGEKLAEALCRAMEPELPKILAREARKGTGGWNDPYPSPLGWWEASIRRHTDEDQNPFVRWRPIEFGIVAAFRAVDEMRRLGYLMHILEMTNGWVVNASRYDIQFGWNNAKMIDHMVAQEAGPDAPTAIARAALAALQSQLPAVAPGKD